MIFPHSKKFAACLYTVLLSVAAAAQAPAEKPAAPSLQPSQAQAQAPPLRVTTRLVQVNVVVQDKKGEPVADLTRDDFTLLDQGQPQTISVFSVESSRTLPAPAQPLPPNVYSNRLEQKAGTPTSVTAILLDGLNTRFQDMAYARAQIIKFLEQLQPQDRVALYTLTNRLHILHEFTSDATPLLRAIARHKGHQPPELAASEPEPADTGEQELDDFLNQSNQVMADFYTINRAQRTAQALEDIANHLARLPGRKNLIWVSSSFPFSIGVDDMDITSTRERRTFSPEIERAARALNNANLAIYPVDARGLIGVNFVSAAARAPMGPIRGRGPASGGLPTRSAISPNPANFDTMNILAERTGGRAFYNTNDIYGSVRRAIDDSRATYVLGYYPSHGQWDGKFREIKVQVERPGLHLRHRRGYFALPEMPQDPKQHQAWLVEALNSPLDATSLGLNVAVEPADVPGARTLKMEVHIDPRDITLNQEGDRWVGGLELLFAQRGADGTNLTQELKNFSMRPTQATYENIMKEGLTLTRNLPIVAGAEQVRVVVMDATSGEIGSVSIPLSRYFPNPAASQP